MLSNRQTPTRHINHAGLPNALLEETAKKLEQLNRCRVRQGVTIISNIADTSGKRLCPYASRGEMHPDRKTKYTTKLIWKWNTGKSGQKPFGQHLQQTERPQPEHLGTGRKTKKHPSIEPHRETRIQPPFI